jgi:glycosyltransferase involved in cell wall biosynthesis
MKRKLILIEIEHFFDFKENRPTIGGVQTYAQNLARLGVDLGFEVNIYLPSKNKDIKTASYMGFAIQTIHEKSIFKSLNQACYEYIIKHIAKPSDKIVIMRDDLLRIKKLTSNTYVIQHGITFDVPGYYLNGLTKNSKILSVFNKTLRCFKSLSYVYSTKNLVCVDYNYFNWFRTIGTIYPDQNMVVVPNFSSGKISQEEFDAKNNRTNNTKKIVFARRFVTLRGTSLFANVILNLLKTHDDIDVTFAGTGSLEKDLKIRFEGFKNVHFTSYAPDESIGFHSQFDIAIVPTIWSEGTSLSLLEAMSAGCFPIATYVGGLSNILIDNYNGKLIAPTYDSLYDAISEVLNLPSEKFKEIQTNAYTTATKGFCKANWENKWKKILSK